MPRVDLNCDLGEGAGHDEELMRLITSANIACGAHAGSRQTMSRAIQLAARHGVRIGAHPGHFDRKEFGRAERAIGPDEAGQIIGRQIARLHAIAGSRLGHVKLHGALYNQVSRDAKLAAGVVQELARAWPDLILIALAGSRLAAEGRARGLRVAEEVFADRTYEPDGSLTPRSRPDAFVTDADTAVAQVLRMVTEGRVRATDGAEVQIVADTVCLHGDGPHAVAFARRLRVELGAAGVEVKPVSARS